MQTAAIILFSLALAATAGTVPLCYSVGAERGPGSWGAFIWIVFAGMGRGFLTALGMVLLAAAGRVDGMMSGRALQVAALMGAVVVTEVAAGAVNIFCATAVSRGLGSATVLAAIGFLVPAVLAAGGVLVAWGRPEAGWVVAASVGLAIAGGAGSYLYVTGESTGYVTELGKATREIEKVKAGKGMAEILPFLGDRYDSLVQAEAADRLAQIAGVEEELVRALRGPERALAMKALTRHAGLRKDERAKEYWEAAAALAEELRGKGVREGEEVNALRGMAGVLVYEDGWFPDEARVVARFAETLESPELGNLVGMYLRKR